LDKPKQTQNSLRYTGLTMQLLVVLGIAVFAGYKLDKRINWKVPVFLILFPLIALGISLWQVIKEFSKPGK